MKRFYEIKNIDNSVMDVDDTSRRVKVAISETGSLDLDGDIIDAGAYNKTLKERGPAPGGANLIWHLTDHNPSLKSAVGKFSELYMEGNRLVGVTNIPNTSWGNDVLEFYKSGHINQHSIGFKTIKSEKDASTDANIIKEVFLYEGSSVLWAANPSTPALSVGKSLTKEEAQETVLKINEELLMLTKSIRDGRYTDHAFEMIEMRMGQLNERIKNLMPYITQPAAEAVEPKEDEKIKTSIQNILNKLQ